MGTVLLAGVASRAVSAPGITRWSGRRPRYFPRRSQWNEASRSWRARSALEPISAIRCAASRWDSAPPCSLGIPLGFDARLVSAVNQVVNPVLQMLRPISPIAWIPVAILMFGVGDTAAVFLIFLGAFFPIVVACVSGVSNVPSIYRRAGRNLASHRHNSWRGSFFRPPFRRSSLVCGSLSASRGW